MKQRGIGNHERSPHKINILLTRFPDNGSRAISFFKRSYYTNASIGSNEDMNTFYSFVWKGFLVEKVTKYVKPNVDPYPCSLYELEKLYLPVCNDTWNGVKKFFLEENNMR